MNADKSAQISEIKSAQICERKRRYYADGRRKLMLIKKYSIS